MTRSKNLPKNIEGRRLMSFSVDYNKTVGRAIAECGLRREGYAIDSNKYLNQPHEKGVVALVGKLFHFGHPVEPWVPAAVMSKKGYRPATPLELLAFIKKFPNEYRKYQIVTPGFPVKSVGGMDAFMFVKLDSDNSRPVVSVSAVFVHWHGYTRFLGILKTEVLASEA